MRVLLKSAFFLAGIGLLLSSCGTKGDPELQQRIEFYQSEVSKDLKDGLSRAGEVQIDTLLTLYMRYADNHRDSFAAVYLDKAAGLYRLTRQLDMSMACYERIEVEFKDHPLHPMAIFNQALMLEVDARNTEQARDKYALFLGLYPDHKYAESIRQNLQILDIPIESLIDSFERGLEDSLREALQVDSVSS